MQEGEKNLLKEDMFIIFVNYNAGCPWVFDSAEKFYIDVF